MSKRTEEDHRELARLVRVIHTRAEARRNHERQEDEASRATSATARLTSDVTTRPPDQDRDGRGRHGV